MIYLFIFIFGISIGSFLNVLIYRLPNNLSLMGRSFCPKCKKIIHWYDNVPVLSFLLIGRKCRSCRFPISWQYPVVEILTAILFVFVFIFSTDGNIKYQISNIKYIISLGYYLFIVSSLIVVFFIDLKHGVIPDKILYPAVIISTVFLFINSNSLFINHFLSALGAFVFFLLLFLITKGRGMGFGDVKLVLLMGLILGFPKIIVALYAAFLTGAFVSLILIVLKKKKFFGGTIPFGPFLVQGTIAAMFFGELILKYALIYVFRL